MSRFNNTPAPVNYVPGLGRGASGFTTRSDIGPARAAPEPGTVPEVVPRQGRADDDEKEDYSESNYDKFSGYGGSLFKSSEPYDHDDKEADAIYERIDARQDERRRTRREAKQRDQIQKFRKERPKVQQQFADLKRELGKVSADEWAAIPDVGDYSVKKRQRPEKFTPVPDSLLASVRPEAQMGNTVDAKTQGLVAEGTTTDLTQIGAARKTVLNLQLHKMADSVTGQTVVDPKNYMTDLNAIKVNSDAEIGDIKKARLLLRSVTSTNPTHAPGWVAAARLEEMAGKLAEARKIIERGCRACPRNADVWLEASRLHPPSKAKGILARAVKEIPEAVTVWLRAADLEEDVANRKRVYRKALEYIPNSVRLWKAAVELEEPETARILLSRAVECVPHSVEMWIALAHLETYANAQKVLNKAVEANPTHPQIWIAAAKLEDARGNEAAVRNIVKKAIASLRAGQVYISRGQWLTEAERAERAGALLTTRAIVEQVLPMGVEEEDRKRTWVDDAEGLLERGAVHTARAIYGQTLAVFPAKKSVWLRLAFLEKAHGTREALDQVLSRAVSFCPQADILWLMGAKEKWLAGDIDAAREILLQAFKANPNKENIWLAAVKLEKENNEHDRARALLEKARRSTGTRKLWAKSVLLERELGNLAGEYELARGAVAAHPEDPKVHFLRLETEERRADAGVVTYGQVQALYQKVLRIVPAAEQVWIRAAQWEERKSPTLARAMLEQARVKIPRAPALWLEAVRLEMNAGNTAMAKGLLARSLQECPASGLLWSHAILMEPRARQKTKSFDALKVCDQDPHVVTTVARIFWMDLKYQKAKRWFDRVVSLAPAQGDTWAWFYKFLCEHGTEADRVKLITRCAQAAPTKGEYWKFVSRLPEHSSKQVNELLPVVASHLDHPSSPDLGPYRREHKKEST